MKILIKNITVLILLLGPLKVMSSVRTQSSFHGFGAVTALGIPASYRLGGKSFEIGLLSTGIIGVTWNIDLSPNIYSSMGIGYNTGAAGMYGAIGTEFWDFRYIGFRFEAGAFVNYKNDSSGMLLLGINIGI